MPFEQRLEQLARRAVVETPLTFLQKQPKMRPRDPIVAPKVPLGLVPEVLDPVDVSPLALREARLMG